ncbi:hypothetical protein D3C71_1672650 [compost metagenome]
MTGISLIAGMSENEKENALPVKVGVVSPILVVLPLYSGLKPPTSKRFFFTNARKQIRLYVAPVSNTKFAGCDCPEVTLNVPGMINSPEEKFTGTTVPF